MTEYTAQDSGLNDNQLVKEFVDAAIRYKDGDSFIFADTDEHVIVCCDCGLTHKIKIEKLDDSSYRIMTWRATDLTKEFRQNSKHFFIHNPVKSVTEVVDNREDNITVKNDDNKQV